MKESSPLLEFWLHDRQLYALMAIPNAQPMVVVQVLSVDMKWEEGWQIGRYADGTMNEG
jgi:hypothetical protein